MFCQLTQFNLGCQRFLLFLQLCDVLRMVLQSLLARPVIICDFCHFICQLLARLPILILQHEIDRQFLIKGLKLLVYCIFSHKIGIDPPSRIVYHALNSIQHCHSFVLHCTLCNLFLKFRKVRLLC